MSYTRVLLKDSASSKNAISIILIAIILIVGLVELYKMNDCIVQHINKIDDVIHRSSAVYSTAIQQADVLSGELFHMYTEQRFNTLRKGLDRSSNEVLNYVQDAITYNKFYKNATYAKKSISFPAQHLLHQQRWKAELPIILQTYNLGDHQNFINPEAFYFHHGLRFANHKILNYIKDKDILDCGAFIGDSLLVLWQYTNAKIYCYEFSDAHIETLNKIASLNLIPKHKYETIPVALGDEVGAIKINNSNNINPGKQVVSGNSQSIQQTTIDEEDTIRKFRVGFIKADLEGDGMRFVKGAINTIVKHRPVLALAVYHNTDELFGIKPFLEQHLKDYVFEFQLHQFCVGEIYETILFCYPKELQQQ